MSRVDDIIYKPQGTRAARFCNLTRASERARLIKSCLVRDEQWEKSSCLWQCYCRPFDYTICIA